MSVVLESVALAPLRFPMKRKVASSKAEWQSREGIVLRVEGGGATGLGEASPLPGFSVETLEETRLSLERAAAVVPSLSLALGGDALVAVAEVVRAAEPLTPSARFALETALLDLRAQLQGRPFWRELLGADAETPGPVPLSALLTGDTEEAIVEDALLAAARGIRTAKLKVGRAGEHARELVGARAVRAALGDAFRLRLDANGAWALDEANRAIEAFAGIGPELLEEPVAGERWRALERGPIPLALDETLAAEGGADVLASVLARNLCSAVVVKLGNVGGLVAAVGIARRARAAGASVVVTHMFEGPVAAAASAAFAVTYGRGPYAPGLDVRGYTDLADDHAIGAATVSATSAAGLGFGGRGWARRSR